MTRRQMLALAGSAPAWMASTSSAAAPDFTRMGGTPTAFSMRSRASGGGRGGAGRGGAGRGGAGQDAAARRRHRRPKPRRGRVSTLSSTATTSGWEASR